MGLDPSIQEIWNLDIAQGRFINDADNAQHGLYAVLGSEARDRLFSGMNAVTARRFVSPASHFKSWACSSRECRREMTMTIAWSTFPSIPWT